MTFFKPLVTPSPLLSSANRAFLALSSAFSSIFRSSNKFAGGGGGGGGGPPAAGAGGTPEKKVGNLNFYGSKLD